MVYGDEEQRADQGVQQLQANPSVWRHRPRITVDQFFRQFHLQVETRADRQGAFAVLRLFKAKVWFAFMFVSAWFDTCSSERINDHQVV